MSQGSIDRLVSNADLHFSTLRQQVEAAGGTLELLVELPGNGVPHLTGVAV